MKLKRFIFGFFVTAAMLCYQTLSAKTLNDEVLFSTALIENQSTRSQGTGFVICRQVGSNSFLWALVSNRHVLEPSLPVPSQSNQTALATVSFNLVDGDLFRRTNIVVALRQESGNTLVKYHSNTNVDIAALLITSEITRLSAPGRSLIKGIGEERFASRDFVRRSYVSAGDTAVIIGYPLNLVEQGHVLPVARHAVIATKPDLDFRGLPAFLIDATVLRGSSGSPVILPIMPYVWRDKNTIDRTAIQENYLLGIASATVKDWEIVLRKVVSPETVQEFTVTDTANLGIVWRADAISEVIDMFGFKRWQQ